MNCIADSADFVAIDCFTGTCTKYKVQAESFVLKCEYSNRDPSNMIQVNVVQSETVFMDLYASTLINAKKTVSNIH